MGKQYKALVLGFLFFCSVILPSFSFQKETQAVEVAYTVPFSPWITIKNIVWTGLGNGDTGKPLVGLGKWDTATIQVTGTFAGATCTIEASNDTGTPTWYTAKDITVAGVYVINAGYYQVRPKISAGAGATLTITLVATESTPDTKKLDDLLDVVISNPLNLHIPQYNSTTSKFENSLCGCPGGTVGGSNTHVQFNNNSTFGGDAGFTYNSTTDIATLVGLNLTGSFDISNANPIVTLTDTTALAKSLQINIDSDLAYFKEKADAGINLMTMDLARNRIFFGTGANFVADINTYMFSFTTDKPSTDSDRFIRMGQITKTSRAEQQVLYIDNTVSGTASTVNITTEERGIQIYNGFDGGNGTVARAVALDIWNDNLSTTAFVTTIEGIRLDFFRSGAGSANTTNTYGIRMARDTGTRTRKYGFYYGSDAEQAEPTGSYAIYAATDPSFFGGDVGIKVTPISTLDVNGNIRLGTDHQNNVSRFIGFWNVSTLGGSGTSGIEIRSSTPGSFSQSIYFWTHEYNVASGTPRMIIQYNGKVGIVTLTPTALLHLGAGTATANTAPLKFTSGTNLTTPEVGTVEFVDNGTAGNFYMTTNVATVATRREVLLGTGWTAYTPVVTSETGGWTNYTATGFYRVVDKMLKVSFRVGFSAASAAAGSMYISLPTGLTMNGAVMAGGTGWDVTQVGLAMLGDSGTISGVPAFVNTRTSTTVLVKYYNAAAASYLTGISLSDTAPWTWAASDEVVGEFAVPIL